MFNILIAGHGQFATGIKSSIDLLLGKSENVHAQNLDTDLTHDEFEKIIDEYVTQYEKLIVFADVSGGAPSQITTRKILTLKKSKDQYVISGMPVSVILDICMKVLFLGETEGDLTQAIEASFDQAREMMTVVSTNSFMD